MAKRWSVSSVKCVFFRTQAREFVSVTEGAGSLDGMSTWWRNMVSGEGEMAVRSYAFTILCVEPQPLDCEVPETRKCEGYPQVFSG